MRASEDKAALRARFRAVRASLSEADYAARSAALCDRLAAELILRDAAVVHAFWPMTARREPDLRPLLRTLHARGVTVVLPVVEAFEGPPRLVHRRFEGEAALDVNRWGIAEPTGEPVALDAVEAVLVPALGVGRNGYRIGHGRGFYDAFLAGLTVPTLCPVYAECLVAHVPAEPHDVPVTAVVTERETVRVALPGSG